MTDTTPPAGPPQIDLYTRNGFVGPMSMMARTQYTPDFTRVEGDYVPRRLEAWHTLPEAADPRGLPVPILKSATTSLAVWQRSEDTPFAVKDVHRDQVLYVLEGETRLETDFGVLDIKALDVVKVPRSVAIRLKNVSSLHLIVLSTESQLNLNPENEAVLSSFDIDVPRPYEDPVGAPGEYELLLCHGDGITRYFYDYDPLPIIQVEGAPVVQRFSLANVKSLESRPGVPAPPPARLFDGNIDETMVYFLGSRVAGRPPVHHNADYDELGLYVKGPDALGGLTVPGSIVWVPKGVIHQGPEENVPDGYVAWLIETRSNLELTAAGREMAQLVETSQFEVHPSARTAAASI